MWLYDSSVGKKVVMSISGIALILFLTFHAAMNIVVLFSGEAYNSVCEFLGSNWYAVAGTLVLAFLVALHFVYAFILTLQNRKARGTNRYAVTARPGKVEWASQNMFVLGIIVVLGLLLHLYNFWANMMLAELTGNAGACGIEPTDGAAFIASDFRQSCLRADLHCLARGSLVPPHPRLLERIPNTRYQRQNMVLPLESDRLCLRNSGCACIRGCGIEIRSLWRSLLILYPSL